MIDSTEFRRFIDKAAACGGENFMLDLANIIYTAGMEDMRKRAEQPVDEQHES